MKLPAHLRTKQGRIRLAALRRWASRVRGFWGEPVYLCGSALLDFNADPRDWDIRVCLEDDDFGRRFGPVGDWNQEGLTGKWGRTRFRWSDRCVKDSKDAARHTGLNIDFQVYPASHWPHYRGKPRLRLDTR